MVLGCPLSHGCSGCHPRIGRADRPDGNHLSVWINHRCNAMVCFEKGLAAISIVDCSDWVGISGCVFLMDKIHLLKPRQFATRFHNIRAVFWPPDEAVTSLSWRRHHGRIRWWTTATILGFTGGFFLSGLASNSPWPSPTIVRIDILSTLVPPAAASLVTGLVLKNHLLSQASAYRIPEA